MFLLCCNKSNESGIRETIFIYWKVKTAVFSGIWIYTLLSIQIKARLPFGCNRIFAAIAWVFLWCFLYDLYQKSLTNWSLYQYNSVFKNAFDPQLGLTTGNVFFLFFWNTYVELFLLMRTLMHLKCYRPRSSLLAGLPRKNEWAGFYVDQTHHKQPQNKQKKRHKKQNPQHNHSNIFCLLTRTNHKQQPKKKKQRKSTAQPQNPSFVLIIRSLQNKNNQYK